MITFVLLAAALTVAAIVAIALPLLGRRWMAATPPSPWVALGAAVFVAVGSVLLYVSWSNWPWRAATPSADSPQKMVARLARELESKPDNLDGWLMLGRSYLVLQEYPLALRAFERAARLTNNQNAEALVGEAEALALNDESELDGRAGRLVEQALLLAPDSGKALFFGAVAAGRRGDLPLARERFAKLLTTNPPENLRVLLEQQISAIDDKLASAKAPAGTSSPRAGSATPGAADSAVVRVEVSLAPALVSAAGKAALFVFVREGGGAQGPPLAVKRLESRFPQTVSLTPADSMVPGRSFASGQSVQVVARIAVSGNPVAASGDPFGEVTYRVGRDGLMNLVIDRLTP
ncbi:MAG TPA: hypothetical protein VEH54_01410 [Steroidobacteraceae bacterium]|nr:hypothetical protein [Steroidobacteraceae bacterium]